jgi:hypothetical protein
VADLRATAVLHERPFATAAGKRNDNAGQETGRGKTGFHIGGEDEADS